MTPRDQLIKRGFDLVSAGTGLLIVWPIILVCWVIARIDTSASGFFLQERVGRGGRTFKVVKLRTMRAEKGTNVTTVGDQRITKWGAKFRRWKLDELPQLWNVLLGNMSLVGPRPDVPGYMDRLEGEQRKLLELRPGITGPASLKYHNEELLLAEQEDPKAYNDSVIWPDKVLINLEYQENWSFGRDVSYIVKSVYR